MPGWDASDVKEKLEDLEKRQADRKQLHWVHPALPSDDAAWLATRQAFTSSAEALFKAFGLPNAAAQQEALVLDLDCGEQSDIIGAMKKALGLERLVREHADRYPEEQLQGWGHALLRIARFFMGTGLLDLSSALGCPLSLPWVRRVFVRLHWALILAMALVANGKISLLALAGFLSVGAAYAVCTTDSEDLPARAKGLKALQGGQATATALRQQCAAAEACPLLHAALLAAAEDHAAALRRDRLRRLGMLDKQESWLDPVGTLQRTAQRVWRRLTAQ